MKLNEWLKKECMTQEYLSMLLNVNRCLISLWKNGGRRIGPKTLKELRRITNGEVSQIEDVRN